MNPALSTPAQAQSNLALESCRATIFSVADYWFALPATAILKVISPSEEETTSQLPLWNQHLLVRLDLHQALARSNGNQRFDPQSTASAAPKYVIIAWSPTGDRCAIPVDQLPMLREIPLAEVQLLPPHYRQTISNIARYMVALPHQGSLLTLLLLDLQQALHKCSH